MAFWNRGQCHLLKGNPTRAEADMAEAVRRMAAALPGNGRCSAPGFVLQCLEFAELLLPCDVPEKDRRGCRSNRTQIVRETAPLAGPPDDDSLD